MDRNREARRVSMAAPNGLTRRRHRSSGLRDSPEEDGQLELQEPARLRDRGLKKDRDRDRERDRDRDRERDRERDRSSRSKRRRAAERMMPGGNREDEGGDDSSEQSLDDDEEEDDEESAVRMLPPANHHHHHHNHLQHRKSFPPSTNVGKVVRAAPVWKTGDEMIGVSVPRKARSASTKRSHDWISGSGSGGISGEPQVQWQVLTSPVRPTLVSTPTPSPAAPMSPSSSNASVRKKVKSNGPKTKTPKSSSKSSSSNPEELEIEIAEVLYGLMTQGPSKKEIPSNEFDSREVSKPSTDVKSGASSPISNSQSGVLPASAMLPQNSGSSATLLSAVAPKRKRPRQVSEAVGSYGARNSPISSSAATKMEMDLTPKAEVFSPNLEKNSAGSVAENGVAPHETGKSVNSQSLTTPELESTKPEPESKLSTEVTSVEGRDVVVTRENVVTSPKGGSPGMRLDDNCEDETVTSSSTKANLSASETESQKEEKFQIDLMAPPPQPRSSPDRRSEIDLAACNHKVVVPDVDNETKPGKEDGHKLEAISKEEAVNAEVEEKKVKATAEEAEPLKLNENKPRNNLLQFDLEKPDMGSCSSTKAQYQAPKQQQQPSKSAREESLSEKQAQSSSLQSPISLASWPGGLPPMGYVAPLQGVISMDGSTVSPAPIQPLFSQPRPKRCATHCYIARNISYFQQLMKINPFWQAAAGSASLFGPKPCNPNVVPSGNLHGNVAGRNLSSMQDKGQGLVIFPGPNVKEKGAQVANIPDAAQRKQQILFQQALPTIAPNNVLHGPAFIFPLNQQQAAMAAASVQPGSAKSSPMAGNPASSCAPAPATVPVSAGAAGSTSALSFNYPNMPASETQYLAILQNNAYHFPIPTVGAPSNYRGNHAQAMPFFNGSIYSSQMIHPSQLQQPQTSASQGQQIQQGHQNTSNSSALSSSQKHFQSQQQRPQVGTLNGGNGNGNSHNFPVPKSRLLQPAQSQQSQHMPSTKHARQLENEAGGEESSSSVDGRVSRATVNIYGQNFALPIHPQNFALVSPPVLAGSGIASSGNGNHAEKKQQQAQSQALKPGVESLPPHTFAMSFSPLGGANNPPNIDISPMAQNHAILQSLPEATMQYMVAAAASQAAQQKKGSRTSEEVRKGDSSIVDEERKGLAAKSPASVGQSIAFSRPDLTDLTGSVMAGNSVLDSSIRSSNVIVGSARSSRSPMPNSMGAIDPPGSHLQSHLQHQQQQTIQIHKQQQQQLDAAATAAGRTKTVATSNGTVYSDHFSSHSNMAAKFSNVHSQFPPNIVQSTNTSPAHSPQWKSSVRATPTQVPSSSTSSLKTLPQQQMRVQQSQTQISFGSNHKSAVPQGQPPSSTNQPPFFPMLVGSPTTSSLSKGASGSPRTSTSTSTSNKTGQASTLSSQQTKGSATVPNQKSSPAGGRNISSILGNSHINAASSTGNKPPQQQQQQLPKNIQHAQLFLSPSYLQSQSPHASSTSSTSSSATGYYLQRRASEPQQQLQPQPQQPPGSPAPSTGMLSLCPVTLSGASTTDPAKAVAGVSNLKGGPLAAGILQPVQFTASAAGLMPGFSYVHSVSPAVQVKPAEQKQPAGNDNLHACWQPEKK